MWLGEICKMENVFAIAIPFIVLAAVASIVAITTSEQRRRNDGWRLFALQYHLQFSTDKQLGYPHITGIYRGRTVYMKVDHRTDQWVLHPQAEYYTQVIINANNSRNLTLSCTFPGNLLLADTVIKKFNLPPLIRSADQLFDSLYSFRGTPVEESIKLIQSAKFRTLLIKLKPTLTSAVSLKINGDTLQFERITVLQNPQGLQRLMDDACDIAENIETEMGIESNTKMLSSMAPTK